MLHPAITTKIRIWDTLILLFYVVYINHIIGSSQNEVRISGSSELY